MGFVLSVVGAQCHHPCAQRAEEVTLNCSFSHAPLPNSTSKLYGARCSAVQHHASTRRGYRGWHCRYGPNLVSGHVHKRVTGGCVPLKCGFLFRQGLLARWNCSDLDLRLFYWRPKTRLVVDVGLSKAKALMQVRQHTSYPYVALVLALGHVGQIFVIHQLLGAMWVHGFDNNPIIRELYNHGLGWAKFNHRSCVFNEVGYKIGRDV